MSLTVCAACGFASVAHSAEPNRSSLASLATMAGRVGGATGARNVSLEFVAPRISSKAVANLESTLEPRLASSGAISALETSAVGSSATRPTMSLEAAVNIRSSAVADPRRFRSSARSAPPAPHPQMTLGWNASATHSAATVDSSLTKASYSPHQAIVPTTGELGLPQRKSVFSASAVVEPVSQPTSAFANSRLDFSSEPAGNSLQPLANPQLGSPGLMHRTR